MKPAPVNPALLNLARLLARTAFERLQRGETLPPIAPKKLPSKQPAA